MNFISGNFNKCLFNSDLLISSSSTACMHAMAKGVPVIIIGNNFGLVNNPVPDNAPQDLWKLCLDENDFMKAINFFIDSNQVTAETRCQTADQVRRGYFEPVSRENVLKMLNL